MPMQDVISSAAFVAGRNLAAQGFTCKRSHLTETIAALLGYNTHAALVTEEADASLDYHGQDAELYIVNWPLALERAQAMGLPEQAADACYLAFKDAAGRPVFRDVADFWDSHAREQMEDSIAANVVTADMNAIFSDNPELEDGIERESVWEARETWTIESAGTWDGDFDWDGDRLFNGDKMDVSGRFFYAKAGRAGLIFQDSEEGGAPDDSWRDEPEDWT